MLKVMLSEKDKMLAGKPYLANGKELFEERQFAKEIVHKFNSLAPSEIKARHVILKELFSGNQKNLYVEPPFRCDYGYNISIGKNFYANYNLTVLDAATVLIGDNVMIGPNVSLITVNHPIHQLYRNKGFEIASPITIQNNVWICANVVVNPGVTIGENSIIGSGSVVTKNVPENVVAAGNPCKVLRQITDEDLKDFKLLLENP